MSHNQTTMDGDPTTLTSNHWTWLQHQEKIHSLVDIIREQTNPPPFTRVRGYVRGQRATLIAYTLLILHTNFLSVPVLFNMIFLALLWAPAITPYAFPSAHGHSPPSVGPRCTLWNKYDLQTFKSQIEQQATQTPEKFESLQQASSWYAALTADIRKITESICDTKPKNPAINLKNGTLPCKHVGTQFFFTDV